MQTDMQIAPKKIQRFTELFSEFVASYPHSFDGERDIQMYSQSRMMGQANYQEVLAAAKRGENITDLVLQKLLPHANTDGNRAKGAWIHIAPSVTKDVKTWFEKANWTKADNWPIVAQAVLQFVSRCIADPSSLVIGCQEFSALPYTKGFQTGMLTPILNALRQDEFLLINSKTRLVINDLSERNFNLGLLDYPKANEIGKSLIAALANEMKLKVDFEMRPEDLFDMFCHWLVAVKHGSLKPVSHSKIGQGETTWGGSLHQVFRLLPGDRRSPNLLCFLEADGRTPLEVRKRLPYAKERSFSHDAEGPDPKRYRDGKQIYQTAGLLYEHNGTIILTELGHAVRRWLAILTLQNRAILARHAAYALASCQLRNPTGSGRKYAATVSVFPFAFIWRAMLALDNRISSDELNRSIFKVKNEKELQTAISTIRQARLESNPMILGDETISGRAKNDRIIPWISLASFGWILFRDKCDADDGDYYKLDLDMVPLIREAAQVRHRHREFTDTEEYIRYISNSAALPKDLR